MTEPAKAPTVTNRVFINGNIITMDESDTIVEALIIRNGQIVETGNNTEIKKKDV